MKEDNCTFFIEGIPGWSWSHCCEKHDKAYELQVPKLEADVALFQCTAASAEGLLSVPAFLLGALMFAVVSLAGHKFYKKK